MKKQNYIHQTNNRKHLNNAGLVVETIEQLEKERDEVYAKGETVKAASLDITIDQLYSSLKFHVKEQLKQDNQKRNAA